MSRLQTLWLSVRGRRFLLRRMDYALLGKSTPRGYDRIRAQRTAVLLGGLLSVGMMAAGGVMSALQPRLDAGDAALLMSRRSGALFVRVGHTLHPVTDLASARLILDSPENPRIVDDAALARLERGPLLGIAGGPHSLGTMVAPVRAEWSVCDGAAGTTRVTVRDEPANLVPATVLVTTGGPGARVYLLYDGRRAQVDPGDPVTARALHLENVRPRRVSVTLLAVLPESPAIAVPVIPGRGERSHLGGHTVGAVLRVTRAGATEYYVVLRDGVQRVGRLAADLIRFADPGVELEIATAPADLVVGSPLSDTLPVADYPDEVPAVTDPGDEVCATWVAGRTAVGGGPAVAGGTAPLRLAGADGDGPAVDEVSMPAGFTLDVAPTTTPGRYLVTDAGVRFSLRDSAAATAIGLTDSPAPVPWPILGSLPAGPELGRETALVAWDVVGTGRPPS